MLRNAVERNAAIGFVVSVALAAVKLVAGLAGHSSALMADAVESFADSIGSVLVLKALRVASKPPDADHPHGYGKAEAIAALSVGGMLVVAAILIVIEAAQELMNPHAAPAAWTLGVLIGVIAVKEILFRFAIRGADDFDSAAARADAWHHRSDAITSAAAVVGVSVAVWGPGMAGIPELILADEVAAILASGIVLLTASRLIRPALHELLDAASHEISEEVAAIARTDPSVKLVEKTYVRKSGSGYFIDMHLHVDPTLSVLEGHQIAGRVKSVIKSQRSAIRSVLIHIEPSYLPGCDLPAPATLPRRPR